MPGEFYEFGEPLESLPSEETRFGNCFISPLMEMSRTMYSLQSSHRQSKIPDTDQQSASVKVLVLSVVLSVAVQLPSHCSVMEHNAYQKFWEFILEIQL